MAVGEADADDDSSMDVIVDRRWQQRRVLQPKTKMRVFNYDVA